VLAANAGVFFAGAEAVMLGPLYIIDKKITPTEARNNSTPRAAAIPMIHGQGVERFLDPARLLFELVGML
jgi:hypothetical protein